jgi:hypothetical protein
LFSARQMKRHKGLRTCALWRGDIRLSGSFPIRYQEAFQCLRRASRCIMKQQAEGAKQASGTHQYGDKEHGHPCKRPKSLIVSLADLIP